MGLTARRQVAPLTLASGCLPATIGVLVFLPAAWSGRLADDYVLEGTLQRAGGIDWAFTHNDLGQAVGSGHFYRPLWVLWNLLIYRISGSPLLAHVGNLALFAVLCVEVCSLVGQLTDSRTSALAAGLLFAVFPSHGESVAWISGNTDLLASVVGLGAVLVALTKRRHWLTEVAVFVLSLAAMLAKEIAFVLPVVLLLAIWSAPASHEATSSQGAKPAWRSSRWRPVESALAAAVLALVVRAIVIGGAGGYGPAFTIKRLFGSAVSFVLATFSAPQIPLIRDPFWLILPAALLIAILWRAAMLWRSGDAPRRRLLLAGTGWFVVAVLPILNQPLDLNTRNGDRLLLLASVGLVIALVALIDLQRLWGRVLVVVIVVACGASCVQNAFAWHAAGVESTRLVAQIDRLADFSHPVIVLSFPTDLGEAHLFPDALANAVQESGHPHALLITCAPMHPLRLSAHQVAFTPLAGGAWLGTSSDQVPFSVGVLGSSSVSVGPGCLIEKVSHSPSAGLGTTLQTYAKPAVMTTPQNILFFNGWDFTRVPSGTS